jgi:hypothetical protein
MSYRNSLYTDIVSNVNSTQGRGSPAGQAIALAAQADEQRTANLIQFIALGETAIGSAVKERAVKEVAERLGVS